MNTSCKFCTFKVIKDGKQIACQLGRIEKFKDNGAEIATEENHLIIKNRFCLALRTETWARKQLNPLKKVREEITIQSDFIIYVGPEHNFKDVKDTIESVINQKLLPRTLRIMLNTDDIKPNRVIDLLEDNLPESITFFVETIAIKDEKGDRRIRTRCLDISADKCDNTYYAVFNAGFKIPSTFLSDLDFRLNDELDRFCLLEPDKDGNGLVVQTKIHKLVMGNRPVKLQQFEDGELISDNIIDKVKFFSEEQNNSHMVKKVNELCQRM